MKTVYLVKSHNVGILGVATNKKSAYKMLCEYGDIVPFLIDVRPSEDFLKLSRDIKDYGFAIIETLKGAVLVEAYNTNEYQPEC